MVMKPQVLGGEKLLVSSSPCFPDCIIYCISRIAYDDNRCREVDLLGLQQ